MKQSFISKWHCKLLICGFCFAMLFPLSLFAQSGTWGDNLTWNLSTDSVLTISGTGAMQKGSFYPWENYQVSKKYNSIVIKEGVTTVAEAAFYGQDKVRHISLPSSLDSIKANAFGETNIAELTIPENVEYVGGGFIDFCYNLKVLYWNTAHLPTTAFSRSPFYNADITTIVFGDKVKVIPNYLLNNVNTLNTVKLPSSIDSIGKYAFYGTKLTEVALPENLHYIGEYAFSKTDIEELTIPASVHSIGRYTFNQCANLKTVHWSSTNITTIPAYLFSQCTILETITLPSSIDSICEYAFSNTNIKELILPEGLQYIGKYALNNCQLTRINFPASLQKIESSNNAFSSHVTYLEIAASDTCWSSTSAYFGRWIDTIDTFVVGESVDSINLQIWFDGMPVVTNIQYNPTTLKYLETPMGLAYLSNDELLLFDIDSDGRMETNANANDFIYHPWGFRKQTIKETLVRNVNTLPFLYNNDNQVDFLLSTNHTNSNPHEISVYANTNNTFTEKCKFSNLTIGLLGTVDVNADGITDIQIADTIFMGQADGTYISTAISFLLPEEIDSIIYEKTMGSGGAIIQPASVALSYNNIISGAVVRPEYNSTNLYKGMDLDRNGYIDLVNLTNGNVLFNYGDNQFRESNIGGRILDIKDLNGDAVPDILFYDSNTQETKLMYYENATFVVKTLVSDLVVTKAWCNDFDRDGDADILLAFNYNWNIGYSFLVFYRNDGNNKYVKKENAFAKYLKFQDCKDIDNDGYYEIIAAFDASKKGYSANVYPSYNIIHCTQDFKAKISTDSIYSAKSTNLSEMVLGDFDGDGWMEYNYKYRYKENSSTKTQYALGKFAGTCNTAPQKMAAPTIIYDAYQQTLQISWKDGVDAETQSVDLTYALRIGSASGKGDILYAHAKADGQRLNLREGNMGHEHQYLFNVSGLLQGKYYIAVQAVDGNAKGGAWSDECVYEHTLLSSAFSIQNNEITTVDTLVISLQAPKNSAYTYDWNFGDSAVVAKEESNRIYLIYNTAGKRTIRLQVTDDKGNKSTWSEQTVDVLPCKLIEGAYAPALLVDFNQDGILDGVNTGSTSGGFLENDGTGNFTSIGRLFNLNLTISSKHNYIDYNMDGLPDIIGYSNKGNVFVNLGEQDFEPIDISTTYFGEPFKNLSGVMTAEINTEYFYDFNNDGQPDMLQYYDYNNTVAYSSRDKFGITPNLGKMQFVEESGRAVFQIDELHKKFYPYDFNQDGYIDLLTYNSIVDESTKQRLYHPILILNKGNWLFEYITLENIVEENKYTNFDNLKMTDIDNDGYADIIFTPTTMTVQIYYGDVNNTYQRTETIYMPADFEGKLSIDNIFDIDNNGYLDILSSNAIIYNFQNENRFEIYVFNSTSYSRYSTMSSVADVNNDEVPDFLAGHFNQTRITNTPPATPTNLRVHQTAEGVVLEWDDSQDKETHRVQMRYNVGVKKRGATGEDAYIISPLNGGSDVAAIIPSHIYQRATRMIVPNSAFEVGKDYEFTVQAIDGWNATSATSAPFTFTMQESNGIVLSAYETCIGEPITAYYSSTETGTPTWETTGGHIKALENGLVEVTYTTNGLYTLTATINNKQYEKTIYVNSDSTSIEFSIPSLVIGGAPVYFTLPQAFADPANEIWFTGDATIQRKGNTLEAVAYFPEEDGTYEIALHYIGRDNCQQEIVYKQTTQVLGNNITPIISIVSIDETTKKNIIHWEVPENVSSQTHIFDQIWVQKEANRTNEFVTIAQLPLTATEFIDMSSDPIVRKSRYRLVVSTKYGGESQPSAVHSNVHVTLNQGLNNSINIIWTPYEGAVIDQYTILRGTSPDNMQVLTTASGYETSYTDKTIVEGEDYYYALSYANTYETEWITMASGKRNKPAMLHSNVAIGTSNVVASTASMETIFPTSLSIACLEVEKKITPTQPKLHLYPSLVPSNTTINRVAWSITQGSDLATINENGELSYIGNGTSGIVTVAAHTIDGSRLSATIDITVEYTPETVAVEQISISPDNIQMTVGDSEVLIQATITPANATNQTITWYSTDTNVATVKTNDGMSNYISAINEGTAMIIATTEDGSLSDTCVVTVYASHIAVTGISLSETSLSLTIGDTHTLIANITPADATNQTIIWTSSNTSVISVTDGVITALAVGNAEVTATTEDGYYTASCQVNVKEKEPEVIAVTGVTLSETNLSLVVGDVHTLIATITPANATNKNLKWRTSSVPIVPVDQGTLTALSAGTVTITVTTEDGGYTATCQVTVTEKQPEEIAVTGISLDVQELQLFVGTTHQLTATIMPDNATNKNITWSTLYADVATVEDGLVTAIAKGTTMITATTEDGNCTSSCMVTVNDDTALENVNATNASGVQKVLENGTIYILRNGEKYTVDGRKVE